MRNKKALDIAQYIFNKGYKSNLQINKLLYISFGFYGAIYNEDLFDSEIEAWKYGPVIRIVYGAFKHGYLDTNYYDASCITENEKKIIDDVLDFYGKKVPQLLIKLTHQNGSPWSKFYIENENNEIDKQEIIKYYTQFIKSSNDFVEVMSTDKLKNIMNSLSKT